MDDGISGAEFANRPGFVRLMAALKPRPPFQVLIMSEESRLGREAIETAYALKQLITAGVRVFFYLEDRERTFDSPTDKLLMSVTAFADELERQKAGLRVYDAMRGRRAPGTYWAGGCSATTTSRCSRPVDRVEASLLQIRHGAHTVFDNRIFAAGEGAAFGRARCPQPDSPGVG